MIFVSFSTGRAPTSEKTTSGSDVPGTPEGRATEFQAATNEAEHYSGEKLLVGAYAAIWLLMMGWIGLLWMKQASVAARLDGLERAIDRAEKRLASGTPSSTATRETDREATGAEAERERSA